MTQDEAALPRRAGALAVVACSSEDDGARLARLLGAGGLDSRVVSGVTGLLDAVLTLGPDVLVVDLEVALAHPGSIAQLVEDQPELRNVPVLLVLPGDGTRPLPPALAPFVADILFRPVQEVELLHRTQAAIARRRRTRDQRESSERLRSMMRRISADIRATNDPGVMMDRFLSGVGQALGASHAALQVFDDDRVSARSNSWCATTGRALLAPPRRDHGAEDLALALELWEGSSVGHFTTDGLPGTGIGAHPGMGTRAGTTSVDLPRAEQSDVGSVPVPEWLPEALGEDARVSGVALAVGEGDTPFGILWIVSEEPDGLVWTGVEAALTQHVLGNLAHGLIQAQLISRQQQAVRKLRALNRAKTDFVGSVNHELRTPLASITGYLEMILDGVGGELPPQARTMLEAVERNTGKLNGLIDNISSLSAEQPDDSQHVPVDVAHLVADVTRGSTDAAADAGIHLTSVLPDQMVAVTGSREELSAALGIVLSNALKFTQADGTVTVHLSIGGTGGLDGTSETGRPGDQTDAGGHDGTNDGGAALAGDTGRHLVHLVVRDTGIGIPPDDLHDLFDPFQRATNTQQVLPGAGVGLAVARKTIEAHRGDISIASELGRGTTVTIRLPLLDVAAIGPAEPGWTDAP